MLLPTAGRRGFFRAVLTGSALLLSVIATAPAAVEITDTGEKPVAKPDPTRTDWVDRVIVLRNDQTQHRIRYQRYLDADGKPGGEASISAINVNHLYEAAWFAFNVTSRNGLTLARQPFEVELLDGQVERKGAEFRWQHPQGQVKLRLILREGDPWLYGQLTVESSAAHSIVFNTAPGGYCPSPETRDRWVWADGIDQQHAATPLALPPAGRFLLYDKVLDPASNSRGHGAAGWVIAGEAEQPQFTCGEYTSALRIDRAAESAPFRFGFRAFLDAPNETALAEFPASADDAMQRLQWDDGLFEVAEKIQIRKP